jgi:hypothetical protein
MKPVAAVSTINFRFFSLLLMMVSSSVAQSTSLGGRVTYNNPGPGVNPFEGPIPLKNAKVIIRTDWPSWSTTQHTNSNGYFGTSIGFLPRQATVTVFFSNDQIEVRGYSTARSFSKSVVYLGKFGECPGGSEGGYIPCDFGLPQDLYSVNIDPAFKAGEDNNDFSLVFEYGNIAANLAIANGVNPPKAFIKYPAETTIIRSSIDGSHPSIPITSSFFWPFENKDFVDYLYPWLPIGTLIDLAFDSKLSENTIYFSKNSPLTTIFHEYGHFIMKSLRGGNWPVDLSEYITLAEPFLHSITDFNQTTRLAYIEGWANFYGASRDFSGTYQGITGYMESPGYIFNATNGFKSELAVGHALFDIYDPSTTSDNDGFQKSFYSLMDNLRYGDNNFENYILRYYSMLSQSEKAALRLMLQIDKMNPPYLVTSIYGPSCVTQYSTATWTSSVSGGTSSNYSYEWKKENVVVGTSSSITLNVTGGFRLTLTVKNGSSTESKYIDVATSCGGGGGGCPFLFTLRDGGWNVDNNVLHRVEVAADQENDITDRYPIRFVPSLSEGTYVLQIKETASDFSFFDQIKLGLIRRNKFSELAISENGIPLLYNLGNVQRPLSIKINGSEQLGKLRINGQAGDHMKISFGKNTLGNVLNSL